MEETVTGVRFSGGWNDVVEQAESVSDALRQADCSEEELAAWEEWRPAASDDVDAVRERTVEQATVQENTVEQEDALEETVAEAKECLGEAAAEAAAGRPEDAADQGQSAAMSVVRTVNTVARKLVRRVERTIYGAVIVRTNPYYFDSELVSAQFQRDDGLLSDREEYELSVDINDDAVREQISEELVGRAG